MSSLFRSAAVEHATRRRAGEVVLAAPIPMRILGALACIAVVAALGFAARRRHEDADAVSVADPGYGILTLQRAASAGPVGKGALSPALDPVPRRRRRQSGRGPEAMIADLIAQLPITRVVVAHRPALIKRASRGLTLERAQAVLAVSSPRAPHHLTPTAATG